MNIRKLLPVLLALGAACHAQTLVHNANGTATPLTITSTTAGNLGIIGIDISTAATGLTLSGGSPESATQVCAIPGANCSILTVSSGTLSFWIVPNMSAGHTSVTRTGGGTVAAVYFYEFSGMQTTNAVFDWLSFCASGSGNPCTAGFTPSTANEAVVVMQRCQGSAAAIGGSTWLNTSFPNGEGSGELTTSAVAEVTATNGAGCASPSNAGLLIAGFRASGGTGTTCSNTLVEMDVTADAAGANPTASKTVTVHQVGDLAVVYGWCKNGCTPTFTLGSETLVATSVTGSSSSSTGQAFISYVLSTTAIGSKTLSLATAGGATEAQVSFKEFTPNPTCTYVHHTDSAEGTGTGTTVNTPTLTPTAGDLVLAFTLAGTTTHVTSVNSPWSCRAYYTTSNNDCTYPTTVNSDGYIYSSAGSSTANNMTLNASGPWEALITSFATSVPTAPSTGRGLLLLGVGQ